MVGEINICMVGDIYKFSVITKSCTCFESHQKYIDVYIQINEVLFIAFLWVGPQQNI